MCRLSCWLHLSLHVQRRVLQSGDSQTKLELSWSELSCNTQRCSSSRHQWCGWTLGSSRDAGTPQQFVSFFVYLLYIIQDLDRSINPGIETVHSRRILAYQLECLKNLTTDLDAIFSLSKLVRQGNKCLKRFWFISASEETRLCDCLLCLYCNCFCFWRNK